MKQYIIRFSLLCICLGIFSYALSMSNYLSYPGSYSRAVAAQQWCEVCLDEHEADQFRTLASCGHSVCLDTLRGVVEQAAKDKSIHELRCPQVGCRIAIPLKNVRRMGFSSDIIRKLNEAEQELTKPTDLAVAQDVVSVLAKAGMPVIQCPQCKCVYEKKDGCDHITCRKCKHEFCWICLVDWKERGPGHGYQCTGTQPYASQVFTEPQINQPFLWTEPNHFDYYQRLAQRRERQRVVLRNSLIAAAVLGVVGYGIYKYYQKSKQKEEDDSATKSKATKASTVK